MKEIIIAYDENTEASPVMGDWVGELVRCNDCKYNDDGECIIKAGWFPVKPDWFCADGEREEGQ